VAQGVLDIERSACRGVFEVIEFMSLSSHRNAIGISATERGGQPRIGGVAAYSDVLARDGRRPTPII
jgi:hypothetical protein